MSRQSAKVAIANPNLNTRFVFRRITNPSENIVSHFFDFCYNEKTCKMDLQVTT